MADITYCNSDCVNTNCDRHSTHAPQDEQITYWVSFADFSDDCPDYDPPLNAA